MDLLAIFLLTFIVMFFWRRRKDAERAQHLIKQKCKTLELQLLEVNFKQEKPQKMAGYWRWCRYYQFEFSSTGDSRYQGQLIMAGSQYKFELPVYRVGDDLYEG
ncbi:hypothetical protein OAG1_00420 [Agarivorans sp. OAG1]|uniref:DUF3301 domain-containing protein n=1 Tax=Agarivorans TaxID=261825 RepID=UPI00128E0054|nr:MULTISPECIES: DUF3301 domain-containing protein [Agarivorans]MPW30436.1 DUF3301 domain-containing protein [Agarivorans sp. B2Z047]UQN42937.1 DUF3301 domain-containing protein [Agarivorans sp. B2Z047]BEU01242.1 hypothetical protein OAG1_00420 [Agarivorans sp. OAG1]